MFSMILRGNQVFLLPTYIFRGSRFLRYGLYNIYYYVNYVCDYICLNGSSKTLKPLCVKRLLDFAWAPVVHVDNKFQFGDVFSKGSHRKNPAKVTKGWLRLSSKKKVSGPSNVSVKPQSKMKLVFKRMLYCPDPQNISVRCHEHLDWRCPMPCYNYDRHDGLSNT